MKIGFWHSKNPDGHLLFEWKMPRVPVVGEYVDVADDLDDGSFCENVWRVEKVSWIFGKRQRQVDSDWPWTRPCQTAWVILSPVDVEPESEYLPESSVLARSQ